jgi:hypothetical protein
VSELLAHQGETHELLVLVAVADDQVLARFAKTQHHLQFGFRSALEPHAVRAAELDDLLDHVTLLIDLDRIDRGIAPAVLEFANCACKPHAERFDPRSEDIREPEQHGQPYALFLEVLRQVEEIERTLRVFTVGANDDSTALAHVEIAGAPALDVVERLGHLDAPTFSSVRRRGGGRRRLDSGHIRS